MNSLGHEAVPLHGQAGAARSGAARLSEKGFPAQAEWEQHLQSLYREIKERVVCTKM